jgi:hypothetical protein
VKPWRLEQSSRILDGLIQVKRFGSAEGNLPPLQRFLSLDVHLLWQNLPLQAVLGPSASTWSPPSWQGEA